MTHVLKLDRRFYLAAMLPLALGILVAGGCQRKQRDRSDAISQALSEAKTKTDDLRKAMRHLAMMTPGNSQNISKELRLELNTWLSTIDTSQPNYSTPQLLSSFPASELAAVGCESPKEMQFGYWDADYLYECRRMQQLSQWIVDFPIRDNLLEPIIDKKCQALDPQAALQLREAYQLFDWTIRNVTLVGEPSSSVEQMTRDARFPLSDSGVGYGYLPWQSLLFSRGDFVERGRVFNALARQRNIVSFWISVGAGPEAAGNLFAVGVLIADQIYLFEPKLGLPILEPDRMELASLTEVQENPRILRRLDLAGQFDYAFESKDIQSIQFLLDLPPCAASLRMQLLEQSLIGDERMVVYSNVDAMRTRLLEVFPKASVSMWWTPLMAQHQAASIQQRLLDTTPFSLNYMALHGVWLLKTPASEGRLMHLAGEFENTLDRRGALATYMDSRVDDESIRRLAYDPNVQKELGVPRRPEDSREAFEQRLAQAQVLFARSKVDAAFLLAQLHFDRGNYEAAENWFKKRVVDVASAEQWHAAGWYALARAYQQQGKLDEAEAALTHLETSLLANPQEPGNRLRLRMLRQQ